MPIRVVRLDLEYEGTEFRGFAPQPGLRTVDGELRRALDRVLDEEVRLSAGGRTDAGVHARGQVVSFDTHSGLPAAELREAVNALTGPDLWVREAADAPGFDARRDAHSRRYQFQVWNAPEPNLWARRWSTHVEEALDLDAMKQAAEPLLGRHDFGAFYTHRAQDDVPKGTMRRVFDARWIQDEEEPRWLRFEIEADAFLRHMVRAIVGSSILVGEGKLGGDALAEMLERPDRRNGGPTAPAAGLTLMEVAY